MGAAARDRSLAGVGRDQCGCNIHCSHDQDFLQRETACGDLPHKRPLTCTCCRNDVAIVQSVLFVDYPTSGRIANSCGNQRNPLLRQKSLWYLGSLSESESESWFGEAELRRASTRKGEHRWTRDPVLTLPEPGSGSSQQQPHPFVPGDRKHLPDFNQCYGSSHDWSP